MIIAFLLLTSVLRLWHGASTGLSNDEAYYWCWSRRLDYWYFDQGPGIAWSLRATTSLLGNSTFAIRSCAILYSIGSLLFLRAFVRNVADERTANWTVVLASAAPLVSLGAVIATYDAPQVFFWCAGLWALERALSGNRVHWLTCSLLCLAGTFSKVPMVFFPLGALFAMATNPAWRHHLRTPFPWLAGLVGIAPLGAMLLWDFQHDHFYTRHTLGLGRRHVDASPGRWLGDFVGGQALAVGPGIFLAECAALATLLLRRSPSFPLSDNLRRFALAFTVPMLAVCIINSTRSKLEINWPISAHMTGIALVAAWWVHLWHQGKRTLVVALAAPSLLIQAVAWHPEIVAYAGLRPTGKSVSKLTENRGRFQIEAAVREEAAALETQTGKRPFRAAVNYKVSAILTYMAPNREEASCLFPGTRRNQFSIWTKPETLVGRDAVVVLDQDAEPVVESLSTLFQTVDPPRTVLVEDPAFRGPIKAWTIFRCRNFLGYDPEESAVGY